MITIQKENKQYSINENQLDLYLSQGFSQIDDEGKVVQAGEAVSLDDIKAENATLKNKLAEYKNNLEKLDQFDAIQAENEALKVENADIKAQLEAATKKNK